MSRPAPDWDDRFRGDEALYGLAPSGFVIDCSLSLAHGARVLCLAEGQGRNALALAARGFRVTALDLSATACRQLTERARAFNLPITVRQQDLGLWSAPEAAFDAAVAVYAHMPRLLRRDLHGQIGRALVPGGMIVIEGFRAEQLGRPSGGPRNIDWLYTEAELRSDFAGFHIEYLATPEVPLDEGQGHQGPGALIRFRARKQR